MLKDQQPFGWAALEDLLLWDKNPRKNDPAVPAVAKSIRRFGFVAPVVVWVGAGRLVAGHTRIKALRHLLKADPSFVPRGAPSAGMVPVRYAEFASQAEADAYALADNRLNEIASWDNDALAEILAEIKSVDASLADVIGYSAAEMSKLLPPADGEAESAPDACEELRKKWQTEEGQLWLIPSRSSAGRSHRILCGDSTSPQHVDQLRGGDRWQLMVTDPPYGVDVAGGTHDPRDKKNHRSGGRVLNDALTDDALLALLSAAFVEFKKGMPGGSCFYVWLAGAKMHLFDPAIRKCLGQIREWLIWVKPNFVFGRSDYHYRHEPCAYGWTDGAAHSWTGGRNQDTVWELEAVGGDLEKRYTPPPNPSSAWLAPFATTSSRGSSCATRSMAAAPPWSLLSASGESATRWS